MTGRVVFALTFGRSDEAPGKPFTFNEGFPPANLGPQVQKRCHPLHPDIRELEEMTNTSLLRGRQS